MEIERRLSRTLLEAHPEEAARALETLDAARAAAVLADGPADVAAGALARTVPHAAASVLTALHPARAAALLAALPFDVAAAHLRRIDAGAREERIAALPDPLARSFRSLLRFPEGTAGALMDPRVAALADDITAAEALRALRTAADRALYNVYVVDRDQNLVGVLNLRELLLARPGERLSAVMGDPVHRLRAGADSLEIVSHPGWQQVHSLPVVDSGGRLLGAIRYRTLRRLEDELRGPLQRTDSPTARALGELFGTALSGWVDALAGAVAAPAPRGS